MSSLTLPADTSVLRGILFMCGAVAVFPVVNAMGKHLGHHYSPIEVIWARVSMQMIFVLLVFAPRLGLRQVFATRRPGAQLARSVAQLVSTGCFFLAIPWLPLADANAISFTTPFIVAMLSVPLLGERVGAARWIAIGIGFLGALIVIRPGFGGTIEPGGALLMLGSATAYALYSVLTRRVSDTDRPETCVAYSALAGTIVSCAIVPLVWRTPDTLLDAGMLASLGILGAVGHYCVAQAYRNGPAATIAPYSYLQLIGSAAIGYLVFADVPDRYTWIGAAIIVAGGLHMARRETARR